MMAWLGLALGNASTPELIHSPQRFSDELGDEDEGLSAWRRSLSAATDGLHKPQYTQRRGSRGDVVANECDSLRVSNVLLAARLDVP